jgi:hypothetical protein
MRQFTFPAVKFRQFNMRSTRRRHPPALFPDHHVPSMNHPIPSTNHHVPSTDRYTASAMLMLANNIWVENLALEAPVKLFRACARFVASEGQEVFHNLKFGSQNYLLTHH